MIQSECTVTHFENHIPSFVEADLDRLYGSRYASLTFFRVYGSTKGASTYVARRNGTATAVFLFRQAKGRVTVLNEGIQISQKDAADFADYLFSRDPSVNAICFNYVETSVQKFFRPCLHTACEEDLILDLPGTVEQYMAGLGKTTRANLKNRMNKIRREFPSFSLGVYERKDADEKAVREILRLSRLRMESKNKVSEIDAEEEERILACVRECGFVCVVTIDGRVCAGSIAFRFGRNFTGRTIAHDPAFDEHRLGFVCAFLAICECIRQKDSQRFYFGWGDNAYKQRLGGKPRQLSSLLIFRSWVHVLPNARAVLRTLVAGTRFRARQKLLEAATGEGSGSSGLAQAIVKGVRWLKAGRAKLQAGSH